MDDTFKHLADNRGKRDGSVVAWVCVTSIQIGMTMASFQAVGNSLSLNCG